MIPKLQQLADDFITRNLAFPDASQQATDIQTSNNDWLYSLALQQQAASQASADRAMQFSHDEAQLQRDWTERMSNSAYQRAVSDLKAAGLNPALAYQQGAATTPSGASAAGSAASMSMAASDTDTIKSILNTILGNESAESIARDRNKTQVYTSVINAISRLIPSGKKS